MGTLDSLLSSFLMPFVTDKLVCSVAKSGIYFSDIHLKYGVGQPESFYLSGGDTP